MPNIFLSHSSTDKKRYVEIVARQLKESFNEHSIHYDEWTFEAGMKSIEEIGNGLEETDLFVVLLSKKALESKWVKKELLTSKKLVEQNVIKRIYPIVIEENIKWDDIEIPEWLTEYTLKYIPKPTKATQLIRKRLIEINWEQNPKIEKQNNVFVGRNKEIEDFEIRQYNYDMETVIAYIAAGLPKLGRSSLLKHCFVKSHIIDNNYRASKIELGRYDGIEDFIIWINDLGFSDDIELTGFMEMNTSEKCEILAKLLDDVSKNREVVFVEDKGCLITHEGVICEWFIETLSKMQEKNRTVLSVASKFRNRLPVRKDTVFIINVPPLNKMECGGLLQEYLKIDGIQLDRDDYKNYSDMLNGFPEQVKYACSLISKYGAKYAYNYSSEIVNYNAEGIAQLMKDFKNSDEDKAFLRFLGEIDMISYQSLQNIIEDTKFVEEKVNKLYINGFVEFVGIANEYIKINASIKDYIMRSEYELSEIYKSKLTKYVEDFLGEYKYEELDMPDYLLKLKMSLVDGNDIENKYMIPSQYLKTMVELYEKEKNYVKVIDYADSVLKSTEYIEDKLLFEIRYFLCMALAKRRERRFLSEVQKFKGADHDFLLGFYYRMTGDNERALERIERSLEQRNNFSKAKREKVQVLMNLERFEEALSVAKENYSNDRSNPYHIHAYFLCLIKSDIADKCDAELRELIKSLELATSDFGNELKGRCGALYEAYINKDADKAFALIDNTIEESSNPIHVLQDKFDICERLYALDEMANVIEQIELLRMGDSYGKDRALYRAKILYAAYKKDSKEIERLKSEISDKKVNLNTKLLERKIEKIMSIE